MEQVWKTVETYGLLQSTDVVLTAVSGGPDSVVLFHLLEQYRNRIPFQMHVIYVHHHLRSEADEEQAYVESLAEQAGIPHTVCHVNVMDYAKENGMSLEEAGHVLRFAEFYKVGKAVGATKLALGHHRDDKAETVLQHLLRGCGLDGMATMPVKNGMIIRPLLYVSKKDLITYCENQQWKYYIDRTNEEPHCLRNKIRLELLPLLEQEYQPQMRNNLVQLSELAAEDADYMDQQTESLWNESATESENEVSYDLQVWRKLHPAMQARIIRYGFGKVAPHGEQLSYRIMKDIMALLAEDQGHRHLDLGMQIGFEKNYRDFSFQRQCKKTEPDKAYCYQWDLKEMIALENGWCFSADEKDIPIGTEYWSCSIPRMTERESIRIRNRKPGDKLYRRGLEQGKKVKDFMIDEKIPAKYRNQWPLVCIGDDIVWIPGYFRKNCLGDREEKYFLYSWRK